MLLMPSCSRAIGLPGVLRGLLLSSLVLLLSGCGREPAAPALPVNITDSTASDAVSRGEVDSEPPATSTGNLEAVALELGTALDADGRVLATVERVRSGDAVHVSLVTIGAAETAKLAVRWRDAAGLGIGADERAISATGPAVHTFSLKPESDWALGTYEVEVSINGESAGLRTFEVR